MVGIKSKQKEPDIELVSSINGMQIVNPKSTDMEFAN